MSGLRRIAPLPLPGVIKPDLGPRPSLEWVAPTDLVLDETYQRDLSPRSMKLLEKMVTEFAWNRLKPPIVVRVGDQLHVINGQHTAIAAATLGLDQVPIFIVTAEATDERARAFVGHNTDQVRVGPLDIYRALVASGDEGACECDAVLKRAGVQVRNLSPTTAVNVGDTSAVGTLRQLVKRRGPMQARRVLEVLVKAQRAPIQAAEIKAAEWIVCTYPKAVSMEQLVRVVRADGARGIEYAHSEARRRAISVWVALSERWIRGLGESVDRQHIA